MSDQSYESIWDALTDTEDGAAHMKVRAELMMHLQSYVAELGVTQAEAAKRLGVTQPRLNDLLQGKLSKFKIDALVTMLAHAGKVVRTRVEEVHEVAAA